MLAGLKFQQVDVFSTLPFKGNPVAVVAGADALSDQQMRDLANWTNLSETTFLLQPTQPGADYRVRIFTPRTELPFAGHPTLGTCHAWMAWGGTPQGDVIVQECQAGLIPVRRSSGMLAFAAPPLIKSGPVDEDLLQQLVAGLRIARGDILDAQWIDNGPGWLGLQLRSRADVLALRPDPAAALNIKFGVVGSWDPAVDGDDAQFEVRAFTVPFGLGEDPVTGSLNAGLAQWLIGSGRAPHRYVASQGTALGRTGRVHVEKAGNDIWIGGATVTRIDGTLTV